MDEAFVTFVVDEIDLVSDFTSGFKNLDARSDLVDRCSSLKCTKVYITNDWQKLNIGAENSVGNFIYSDEVIRNPKRRDSVMKWARISERLEQFDPADCIMDNICEHHFIMFAKSRNGVGIISFAASLHTYVINENSCPKIDSFDVAFRYFSELMINKIECQDDFHLWKSHLFPNLYFHEPNGSIDISRTRIPDNELLPNLLKSLRYLDCSGQRDFKLGSKRFEALAGSAGLSLSQESANTTKNRNAIRERNVVINGNNICCEWHVKFRPNLGRMHFHEGAEVPDCVKKVTFGKLIIGIFTDHLS